MIYVLKYIQLYREGNFEKRANAMIKKQESIVYEVYDGLTQALRIASNLENRLYKSFQYVEPTEDNYQTYSLESRAIIVETCIQIEAIAQLFYYCAVNKQKRFSWKDFYNYIKNIDSVSIYGENKKTSTAVIFLTNAHVEFHPFKSIRLLEYIPICIEPWKEGIGGEMPSWWREGYNKIKHDGNLDLSFCTYYKAIEAIAGLYAMIAFISNEIKCPLMNEQEFKPKLFYSKDLEECYKREV